MRRNRRPRPAPIASRTASLTQHSSEFHRALTSSAGDRSTLRAGAFAIHADRDIRMARALSRGNELHDYAAGCLGVERLPAGVVLVVIPLIAPCDGDASEIHGALGHVGHVDDQV